MADMYTIRSFAELWGVSQRTVYNWLERDELKCIRRGRITRITPQQAEEFRKLWEEKSSQNLSTGSQGSEPHGTSHGLTPKERASAYQLGRKTKHGQSNGEVITLPGCAPLPQSQARP